MRIVMKYILTNVKERKMRTAVMLLSIIFSSMLLFVSFSIGASYESAQRKMARGMAGNATVSVTSVTGSIDVSELPGLPAVGAYAGMIKGMAFYHENGYYETVDMAAADLAQLNQINPPRLADGGEIEELRDGQVILPDRFTSKFGIEKGDTVTLYVGGQAICLEVAGVAAYDTVFLRHTRGATALLPVSTLSRLVGQDSGYQEILVSPAKGVTTKQLKDELEAALPKEGYQVAEIVNEKQIEADARQKSMPFFLISFFSLTMSIFIIYSSYKVITLDRLSVIGTFRSIGATQKTVTRILLLESILYGGMGGAMGILLGLAVLKLLLQGMGRTLAQGIAIPAVVSAPVVLLSFGVAAAVSLFGAWIPVRRASRLPIKDVVLGSVDERHIPHQIIAGIGFLLFVTSASLPWLVSGDKARYLAGGFSLLGLIAAAILIVPVITNLCSRGMEQLYGWVLGNEGRLAARNMRNNKNTVQNITLLFISISAVIAITVVGNFVTAYIGDVFKGAELEGFADGPMDQEFVDTVERMEGVKKVLPVHVLQNQMQANDTTLPRLEATDHLERYSSMFGLHYSEKGMEEQAAAAFDTGRAILLSESCMERTGFKTGSTITLSNGTKQNDYLVAGSFQSRATDVEAVIPSAFAISDFGAANYGLLAYTAADPDAVMIQIRNLFGSVSNWSRTVEEFNQDALSTVEAFLKPMHSMTYFILLLAAVGVVNNLLINHIQKRHTIAMYRSVGMSSRQNERMTLVEGFSSGLIGAVIAILVSYMEIRTIFLVAGPKISMNPELDSYTFLTAGALGILVTLAGSVVPMIKSRRMKLVEEIKFE